MPSVRLPHQESRSCRRPGWLGRKAPVTLFRALRRRKHRAFPATKGIPSAGPAPAPSKAGTWPVFFVFLVGCCCHGFLLQQAAAQTTPPPTLWSFLGITSDQESTNPAIKAAAKAKAAKHKIHKKKAAIAYLAKLGCTAANPEVGPALIAAMSDPDEPVRYEAVKAVYQTAGQCQAPEAKKQAKKSLPISERCGDLKKKVEAEVCGAIEVLLGKAPPKEHKHKLKNKLQSVLGREECVDPSEQDCPTCAGRGSCCSDEMTAQLTKLAHGRGDKGCFLEPSARVREMAELALSACSACNGGCGPCSRRRGGADDGFGGPIYREMPPEEERELPIVEDQSSACHDRAVMANPLRLGHENLATPAPMLGPEMEEPTLPLMEAPRIDELPPPAIELIPLPAPRDPG